MNEKFFNLILLCTAAVVSGCVSVDDEVASVPSVYWKAPKEATMMVKYNEFSKENQDDGENEASADS